MAWFLNFYRCDRCRKIWTDEWSCMCDDDCPHCGARHMSPFDSEDLTELIEQDGNEFVAIRSPDRPSTIPTIASLAAFRRRGRPRISWLRLTKLIVIPGWSEGPDLRCAIFGTSGILRFRVHRSARPGMTAVPHPTLAAATASSDIMITVVSSCSDTVGWVRQRMSFSWNDSVASKNSGS